MLQINDLEVIRNKRIVIRVPEMMLPESTINALVGQEGTGKSLFVRTIHGLYSSYRGIIDFQNINKHRIDSYLLSREVNLLSDKSVNDNLRLASKYRFDSISEYVIIADLENDLERLVQELTYSKKKFLELAIACGMNPCLLIIDDFDKCFNPKELSLVGQILSKYKSEGGCLLLTSRLKIPEMDFTFVIDEDGVVKL